MVLARTVELLAPPRLGSIAVSAEQLVSPNSVSGLGDVGVSLLLVFGRRVLTICFGFDIGRHTVREPVCRQAGTSVT